MRLSIKDYQADSFDNERMDLFSDRRTWNTLVLNQLLMLSPFLRAPK